MYKCVKNEHQRKASCYFVDAELYHHYDTQTRTCANSKQGPQHIITQSLLRAATSLHFPVLAMHVALRLAKTKRAGLQPDFIHFHVQNKTVLRLLQVLCTCSTDQFKHSKQLPFSTGHPRPVHVKTYSKRSLRCQIPTLTCLRSLQLHGLRMFLSGDGPCHAGSLHFLLWAWPRCPTARCTTTWLQSQSSCHSHSHPHFHCSRAHCCWACGPWHRQQTGLTCLCLWQKHEPWLPRGEQAHR